MRNDVPIILLLWPSLSPRHFRRRLPEEGHLLRRLVEDLRSQGIGLIPFPIFPSRFLPFPPYEVDPAEWERWLSRWELESFEQWEDWAYRWERYWPEQEDLLNRWQRYLPEVARSLARLFDVGAIQGMIVVTLPGTEEHVETGALEQLAATIDVAAVVHLTLGPPDDRARIAIRGIRSLHYPNDRSKVLDLLTSMTRATRDELYPAPAAAPSESPTSLRMPASRAPVLAWISTAQD